jgi:ATP-binding cassette subfamily B protein
MVGRGDKSYGLDDGAPSTLKDQMASLARVAPFIWPKGNLNFKLRVIGAFLVILVGAWINVRAPFLLRDASNALETDDIATTTLANVALFIVGYGILRLMSVAVPQIREFLFARVGQTAQREIALMVFRHLHAMSLRFHLERRTGGLSRIIERGIKSIDFLFRFLLFNIGPMLISLVLISIAFIQEYSVIYALIAVVTVAIYFWFTVASTEWRLKFRRDMNKQDQEANTKAIDSLLNYETVKYFNNERFETGRYNKSMRGYQEAAIRSNNSLALVNAGQALVFNTGFVILLLLTAQGILDGRMAVGDLIAVSLVMMNLQQPLNILGFAYREIKQSLVDMEKMFAMLNVVPEVQDRPGATNLAISGGAITFEDVCFSYAPERPILKGISFNAAPGETIAIVGPSGAGKSTISRILYRFYEIESGNVLIDGQDIRDVTQESLRQAIGMVPQDTVLFNDTIAYNIGYAKPGAAHNEIEEAAKLAQIHEFVSALPDGYDSMVGERGLKLSGGEKQRVAIARTILKNPPILILDEATSALDSVTEHEIQAALKTISADRTTLVIAHRLSTIVDADRIIVLKDGQIAEQGTHAELLSVNGEYAALWQQQQEGDSVTA